MEEEEGDEEGGEGSEVEEGNEDENLGEGTVDEDIEGVAGEEDMSQEPEGSSRDNVPDVDQLRPASVPARGQSVTVVSTPVTQSAQQGDISTRRTVGPGPLMSDRPRLHSVRGHLAPFSFTPVSGESPFVSVRLICERKVFLRSMFEKEVFLRECSNLYELLKKLDFQTAK